MTEAQAARFAGVAKFFRAYFYYDKVQRFGDVPWYSHTIEKDDKEMLTKARDPRKLVVDSIIKDLEYAIANIDDATFPVSTDMVSKYTAMALLSRICLFEGTWKKYRNEAGWEDLLRKSATISETLIDSKNIRSTSLPLTRHTGALRIHRAHQG